MKLFPIYQLATFNLIIRTMSSKLKSLLTVSGRFYKDNPMFVLGFSDSRCDNCCWTEPLLKELELAFDAGLHSWKVSSLFADLMGAVKAD